MSDYSKKQAAESAQAARRQVQRDRLREGKKPYFPKQTDIRKEEIMNKYRALEVSQPASQAGKMVAILKHCVQKKVL